MKKGNKVNYQPQPSSKLKRNIDNKSPSIRPDLAFKPQKVVEHKSLQYKHSLGSDRSGRDQDRTNPHYNKPAVRHQYGKEEKNIQGSRSRSNEKKDRLTLNLAKFTRKNKTTINKQEKTPPSVYLQKSTPPEEHPPQPTYPEPSQEPFSSHSQERQDLGWESNDFKHNYLNPPSHSNNRQSMFSEEFQSVISQQTIERHEQKPVTPHYRKVQPVQHKNMEKSQAVGQVSSRPVAKMEASSHSLYANYQNYPSPKSPENTNRAMDVSKKLSSMASERQQNRVIQELSAKMQRERQQHNSTISKLQGQKIQLQRTNKQLIENQFSMKNQIQLLKVKNIQLIKDQDNVKVMASESGQERQRTVQGLEQARKEMEGQLARVMSDLRTKNSQNNHLMVQIRQLEGQCQEYKHEAKALEHKNVILANQLQKEMKTFEAEKQQIINTYEFRLKELSARQSGSSVQEQKLKAILSDKTREVNGLKRQLTIRDKRIQDLTLNTDEGLKERLTNELNSKEVEVQGLIEELNYNQEKMITLTNQLSQSTKYYQSELKKKKQEIGVLEEQLRDYERTVNRQGLGRRAFEEMYHLSEEGERESDAFLEIQQKQSQEMNALRTQMASKNELLQRSQLQNEELKDRIRKLEQERQMNSRSINTNINNLKQAKEAGETVMKAEMESLKRKMGSLEMRLGLKDQQIRDKNKFIQQHLMSGLNGREDAKELLDRLQGIIGMKS